MGGGLRSARRTAVSALRRGHRTVLLAAPGPRLGNLLYFWLRAHARQERDREYVVRHTPEMDPWLPWFPRIAAELTVAETDVRLLDDREHVGARFFQRFGVDFSRSELQSFVRAMVLPSRAFAESLRPTLAARSTLTVNVRRGDYYADPAFREMYGFDVEAYLRIAIAGAAERDGPVDRIHVVSDDVGWCATALPWLADHAPSVTYSSPSDGPRGHLLDIASARRLVLTNSTFSYWGAYISNVLHSDNHAEIWAPRFHSRTYDRGRAWQLDERWSIVEDLPGGWGGQGPSFSGSDSGESRTVSARRRTLE